MALEIEINSNDENERAPIFEEGCGGAVPSFISFRLNLWELLNIHAKRKKSYSYSSLHGTYTLSPPRS